MKQKNSWTRKCKNFIVGLLTLIILMIIACVIKIVFAHEPSSNTIPIIMELIGVLSVIVGILGWTVKWLLHHERNKEGDKDEKDI